MAHRLFGRAAALAGGPEKTHKYHHFQPFGTYGAPAVCRFLGAVGAWRGKENMATALQEHGPLGGIEAFIDMYSMKRTKHLMNTC